MSDEAVRGIPASHADRGGWSFCSATVKDAAPLWREVRDAG